MKHLPNLLSAARLLVAPYLFLVLWRHEYGPSLVLIVICGITDGLDGFLARKLSASSKLGAYLDPVADKVLLSGAFLTLALSGAIEKWLAWIVLGRDAGILLFAGAVFLFTRSLRSFPPSIWGKASTVAQILFILDLIGNLPLLEGFKWAVVALAFVSGLDYLRVGQDIILRGLGKPAPPRP